MVEAVDQAVDAAEQQVGLDGVQVAAGGIGAQRPAVRAVALPGGEAERQLQQGADARQVHRQRRQGVVQRGERPLQRRVQGAAGRQRGETRQGDLLSAVEMAERRRLRIPVEGARAVGVGGEAVLGALVVVAHHGEGCGGVGQGLGRHGTGTLL
ncbi:hypothetical protein D3C78_1336430 [compost metagenome]